MWAWNGNRLVHFCLQLVNFGLQKYCATRNFCGPLFYFSQRNYNVAYSNILGNKRVGGKKATIRCAKIIPIGQEFIKVFTMNRDFVSQNDLGRQNYVRGKIFWGRKSNYFSDYNIIWTWDYNHTRGRWVLNSIKINFFIPNIINLEFRCNISTHCGKILALILLPNTAIQFVFLWEWLESSHSN